MSIGEKCSCLAGISFTDKRNTPHAQRVTVPVCKAVRRRALLDGGKPPSTGAVVVKDGDFHEGRKGLSFNSGQAQEID